MGPKHARGKRRNSRRCKLYWQGFPKKRLFSPRISKHFLGGFVRYQWVTWRKKLFSRNGPFPNFCSGAKAGRTAGKEARRRLLETFFLRFAWRMDAVLIPRIRVFGKIISRFLRLSFLELNRRKSQLFPSPRLFAPRDGSRSAAARLRVRHHIRTCRGRDAYHPNSHSGWPEGGRGDPLFQFEDVEGTLQTILFAL